MWVWLIGWVGRIRPHSERPSTRSISQRAPRKTALLHVGAAPPALGRRWIIPGHLAAAKSRKVRLKKTTSARHLILRESQTNLHIPDGSQKSHDVNALIAVSQKSFYDIFGKGEQIFEIFNCEIQKASMEEAWTKTITSPQIYCRTTLRKISVQLHSRALFLLARISLMFRWHLFHEFYLLIYFSSRLRSHYDTEIFVCCITHLFLLWK